MLKKLIQFKLRILAKIIMAKYKPKVIGITGSVGKTSSKEAVFAVIGDRFRARRSIKNYNNEIGVPLTILGMDSPGRSVLGWIILFLRASKLIFFRDKGYPEILILEMGIDRPGDMDYLLDIARPDIGIITLIGSVHMEYFGSREKLRQEKAKLVRGINPGGWAIINYDSENARKCIFDSKAKVISYGFDEKASLRAIEARFSFEEAKDVSSLQGMSLKLIYNGAATPVLLPNILGFSAVYAAMSGAAAGAALGMNMIEISQALRNFTSPRGRMNIIKGIKQTLIIDDTYNSEPQSAIAGLGVLKMLPGRGRKIAVLGDMLELGAYSEEGHEEVGKVAFKSGANILILVGERALGIKRGAMEEGMSEDFIFHFSRAEDAALFTQERMKRGDIIFVKGSQGMRMEKVVKEIMAEPLRANELLVRQENDWLER